MNPKPNTSTSKSQATLPQALSQLLTAWATRDQPEDEMYAGVTTLLASYRQMGDAESKQGIKLLAPLERLIKEGKPIVPTARKLVLEMR